MGLHANEAWLEQRRFEQDLCIDYHFYPNSRSDDERWDCSGWISAEDFAKTRKKVNERATLMGTGSSLTWDSATAPGEW